MLTEFLTGKGHLIVVAKPDEDMYAYVECLNGSSIDVWETLQHYTSEVEAVMLLAQGRLGAITTAGITASPVTPRPEDTIFLSNFVPAQGEYDTRFMYDKGEWWYWCPFHGDWVSSML